MIIGVGTDLIETERVQKAILKQNFFHRIFTDKERDMIIKCPKKAAGNFAVKEAVVKMFGTGFGRTAPSEIEVLRNENGAPYVVLYGNARQIAAEKNITKIHVSLTNTKDYASAFVIGES